MGRFVKVAEDGDVRPGKAKAVRLADRILVLSPRPARIAADIAVDLPRPRDGVVLASEAFRETCGQVSAALRDGQPPGRLAAQ